MVGLRGDSRRLRMAAAALAVTLAGGLGLASRATGVGPGGALPDLVSDAPDGAVLQTDVSSSTHRLLLRFNGYVHNQGTGPLEIVGQTPVNNTMTATAQRIYDTSGNLVSEDTLLHPSVIYETVDGHNHWHLRAAMRYGLWDAGKSVEVAPSQKVGFCLADSAHVDAFGPGSVVYSQLTTGPLRFCEKNNPTASSVTMGISPGWRDIYGSGVAFQWVDVSDVTPGTYWLSASSDPDNVVEESDETNNGAAFAATSSVIPGFVAQPVSVSNVTAGQSQQVALSAQAFGGGGARKFRIVTLPAHGTIDQAVGQAFDGPQVTYTPAGSYAGSDSFTYEAIDANSEFPHTPARAVVTLSVSTTVPTVSISGAPASMLTGTSIQLTATVSGGVPSVTWSVDGVLGGTTQTGMITTAGLYTAPVTPPPGGSVTIRATSPSAQGQVTIGIDPQPVPAPAPSSSSGPAPSAAPAATPAAVPQKLPTVAPLSAPSVLPPKPIHLLDAPSLARRGNLIFIGALSRKAGTLEVSAWRGSSRIGRCIALTPASRPLTCRIRMHAGSPISGVRVTVRLLVGGKAVALRRATFSRQIASHRNLAIYRGTGLQCWLSDPPR
jgi:hypothetical protein